MATTKSKISDLEKRALQLKQMGGTARIEKQHASGKLTARERIAHLFDHDTFIEFGLFATAPDDPDGKQYPADGVVVGSGKINGRLTYVAAQDFTVGGGSVGKTHAQKIVYVMDQALKVGAPFIQINDSGGARIQEGVDSLDGYGEIFYHNTLLSGVIPQICIIAGPCAGGAAYSPALSDFVIVVDKTAKLFITGPDVVKAVTGQTISAEELGGAKVNVTKSGNAHFIAENDDEAIKICKQLLSYFPQSNTAKVPRIKRFDATDGEPNIELDEVIPDDSRKPYDVREVIKRIVDKDIFQPEQPDFFEVHKKFATNIVVGFSRIGGWSVGIIANQPNSKAGTLDIDASDKASRFIRFCDSMNIPLVTLVDIPGFLPGIDQELGGIIRHGAKMLYAYSEATVPKFTVILRKAYGGAFLAMCAKSLGADRVFAWPTAEIAVMGADGAVSVLYKKELDAAENPTEVRKALTEKYQEQYTTPFIAASHQQVDLLILPHDTRRQLLNALETFESKQELRPYKKHGSIPV